MTTTTDQMADVGPDPGAAGDGTAAAPGRNAVWAVIITGMALFIASLTRLSRAVRPERRAAALGAWGAIGGLAVALGPSVGGAVTTGWSWQSIFWLNVPIGAALVPLARWKLSESRNRATSFDLRGVL